MAINAVQRRALKLKAGRRRPGQRLRRPPRIAEPELARARLERLHLRTVRHLERLTREILFPELERLLEEGRQDGRLDAASTAELLRRIFTLYGQVSTSRAGRDGISRVGKIIDVHTKNGVERQFQFVLGIGLRDETSEFPQNQIDRWVRENVSLITSVGRDELGRMEDLIAEAQRSGTRVEVLAREIEGRFGVSESRARLIARDQTQKFSGQLTRERQTRNGVKRYIWRISGIAPVGDGRVRRDHQSLADTVQSWDDPPIVDPIRGRREHPGGDYQCFPGDARVSIHAPALKAYRRRYRGDLTELVTPSGEAVRCTPNHPILTGRGWLPANLVEVGDYLIEAPRKGGELAIDDPKGRDSMSAEEVFGALSAAGVARRVSDRIPAGAPWFHGDSVDEEVDVIDIDWGLLLERISAGAELVGEDGLAYAAAAALGLSDLSLDGVALGDAADGVMGGLRQREALGAGGASHPFDHGGAAVACRDAVVAKYPEDRLAGDPDRLRDLLDADTLGEGLEDLGRREVEGIRRAWFDGWVYNFETVSGWYGAHGLIVHNCRCTAEPILDEVLGDAVNPAPPKPKRPPRPKPIAPIRPATRKPRAGTRPTPTPEPPRRRTRADKPADAAARERERYLVDGVVIEAGKQTRRVEFRRVRGRRRATLDPIDLEANTRKELDAAARPLPGDTPEAKVESGRANILRLMEGRGFKSAGQQKEIRETLRRMVQAVIPELRSRDIARLNEKRNSITTSRSSGASFHTWEGQIQLLRRHRETLERGGRRPFTRGGLLDRQENTPDKIRERTNSAFKTLIHEEIHAYSPVTSGAYGRDLVGVGIEEGITEVLAKRVVRGGRKTAPAARGTTANATQRKLQAQGDHAYALRLEGDRWVGSSSHAYDRFQESMFRALAEATTTTGKVTPEIVETIELAAIRTRRGVQTKIETPAAHFEAFVDAVAEEAGLDDTQRGTFARELRRGLTARKPSGV